MRTMLNY
ncbi:hypothetical protein MTR67_049114 [Solanum verrucosum]|nr:hypothetical protein MTR67_049114 [Solanum verrucosum]